MTMGVRRCGESHWLLQKEKTSTQKLCFTRKSSVNYISDIIWRADFIRQ